MKRLVALNLALWLFLSLLPLQAIASVLELGHLFLFDAAPYSITEMDFTPPEDAIYEFYITGYECNVSAGDLFLYQQEDRYPAISFTTSQSINNRHLVSAMHRDTAYRLCYDIWNEGGRMQLIVNKAQPVVLALNVPLAIHGQGLYERPLSTHPTVYYSFRAPRNGIYQLTNSLECQLSVYDDSMELIAYGDRKPVSLQLKKDQICHILCASASGSGVLTMSDRFPEVAVSSPCAFQPTGNGEDYVVFSPEKTGFHGLKLTPSGGTHHRLYLYDGMGRLLAAGDEASTLELKQQLSAGQLYQLAVQSDASSCTLTAEAISDPGCTHEETVRIGAVAPGCVTNGETGHEVCRACGTLISLSASITLTGHSRGPWETDIAPTCTSPGTERQFCEVCGTFMAKREIPALGHDMHDATIAPLCDAAGYDCEKCTRCNHTENKRNFVSPTGHMQGEPVDLIAEATCTQAGLIYYRCTVCQKSYREYTPALGHTSEEIGKTMPSSCGGCGYTEYLNCQRCGVDFRINHDAPGHIPGDAIEISYPTCTAGGYIRYRCSMCDQTFVQEASFAPEHIPGRMISVTRAVCGNPSASVSYECLRCKAVFEKNFDGTADCHFSGKLLEHQEPSCSQNEVFTYDCALCTSLIYDKRNAAAHYPKLVGRKTGSCVNRETATYQCLVCEEVYTEAGSFRHSVGSPLRTVPPTCDYEGYTIYYCSDCKREYQDDFVPALKHPDSTLVTRQEPECGIPGYVIRHCNICNLDLTEWLAPLPHELELIPAKAGTEGHPATSKGIRCSQCKFVIRPVMYLPTADSAGMHTAYQDLQANQWYTMGTEFCLRLGLMKGTSSTQFEPAIPMTRAMLVTVLWRYCGSPIIDSTQFSDVPPGKWYSNAVAWAAHYGFVNGMGNGRFAPNENVTREQLVAVLYRFAIYFDKIPDSIKYYIADFPDGPQVQEWAVIPMNWAIQVGLIKGMDGMLMPASNATRAQVATILHRLIPRLLIAEEHLRPELR